MKHRLFALALILSLALPAFAKDCKVRIRKHERHTSIRDKKATYAAAGIPWESRACCVVDHVVPLELGGIDGPPNLQIQTKEEGKRKDRIENYLARQVCEGKMPLAEAQRLVRRWQTVKMR